MTITEFFNMWIDCLILGDFTTIFTTILMMFPVLMNVYLIIKMIKYKDSAILSYIVILFMNIIVTLYFLYSYFVNKGA